LSTFRTNYFCSYFISNKILDSKFHQFEAAFTA
jgi:hypothetical protein